MSFREILQGLLDTHAPAVRAAVFCDHEGERVDAAVGDMDPFELDVLGASCAAVAQRIPAGGRLRARIGEDIVWVVVVELGCYLVVACRPGRDASCRADLPGVAAALVAHL